MAVRTRLWFAMAAAIALSACGGGGGGSDGGTGGGSGGSGGGSGSGLPNPDLIVGASELYISSLQRELEIAQSVGARTDLPLSGSATYSGFGSIFDSSLTTNDTTVASLRNRSVVTNVEATVDFGGRTVSVRQNDFIDVEGKSVSGEVTWSGNYSSTEVGIFDARVQGNVGGTEFDTGADQATVGFFGDQNDSTILGLFRNAPISNPGDGWMQGSAVTGDFAATSN